MRSAPVSLAPVGPFTPQLVTKQTPNPAVFSMSQLAAAKRIYQRSTFTGGGQNLGQGTIPVTINATGTGSVYARCRSSDGATILQGAWLAGTISTTGSQTLNVTGVDARLGWFYLDLSSDGSSWQLGSVLVGMGDMTIITGQSLGVRMVKVEDASQTSVTLASLSLTPDANSSVFHSYADTTSLSSPTWATPADSSNYDSAGCVEYLNRMIAATGVNCGLAGHTAGGTSITAFISGGAEVSATHTNLDAVGGWRHHIHFQGHTDAQNGMSSATFQADLSTFFTDCDSHNTVLGSASNKYVATIPNIANDSWGTAAQRNVIRQAGRDWCTANSATSVDMMDIGLNADGVAGTHQTQAGAITIARHFYRAARPALGLSHNDNGPTFTATLSSSDQKTITLTPTFTNGATALSAVGTPSGRFNVSTKGGYARMPITSFTVNATSIVIVLTNAVAVNDALEISIDHHNTQSTNTTNDGSANIIYDNATDGESGMTTGRAIQPTFANPITVAATTPSLGPTLTAGGAAASYGTGATGFGQCINGSGGFYAEGATSGLGDDGVPYSNVFTVECRFKLSAAPGSTAVIFAGTGVWVGVGTDGKLTGAGPSGLTGTHVVSDNAWHHIRLVVTEDGSTLYLDGVQEATCGALNVFSYSTGTFAIGALHTSGAFQFPGLVDEFASFTTALNTGSFTPPSSPYTGSEANLYSLYHLDSNLNAATVPSVTGTVAATEANDTASASGTVTVTGSGAATEAADTASATGALTVTGSASATEANDNAAATGAASVTGAISATEAADTASIAASDPVAATGAIAEANDSASAAGALTVSGSGTPVEANDNCSGSGTVGAAGSITGSAAIVEADDSATAAGALTVAGSAGIAEADDASSGTGALTVTGSIAANDNGDTMSADGSAGTDVTYPLAGIDQTYPLEGVAQPYPLAS